MVEKPQQLVFQLGEFLALNDPASHARHWVRAMLRLRKLDPDEWFGWDSLLDWLHARGAEALRFFAPGYLPANVARAILLGPLPSQRYLLSAALAEIERELRLREAGIV